jgi:hypothetical protein
MGGHIEESSVSDQVSIRSMDPDPEGQKLPTKIENFGNFMF